MAIALRHHIHILCAVLKFRWIFEFRPKSCYTYFSNNYCACHQICAFKKTDHSGWIKSNRMHYIEFIVDFQYLAILVHIYLHSFFYKKKIFNSTKLALLYNNCSRKKEKEKKKHPYKNRAINFFPRHKFNWSFHVCRLDSMTLMQIVSFEKVHFSNSNERIAIAIACHATWCRYYLFQLY